MELKKLGIHIACALKTFFHLSALAEVLQRNIMGVRVIKRFKYIPTTIYFPIQIGAL